MLGIREWRLGWRVGELALGTQGAIYPYGLFRMRGFCSELNIPPAHFNVLPFENESLVLF